MNWDDENDEKKPYFLILDEMNLSHVERISPTSSVPSNQTKRSLCIIQQD